MSHTTTLRPTVPPVRRAWAAWLVLALLWAQALGVWHHTVHAPGSKPARVEATAPAEASGTSWRSPLHHTANSSDCRLLDQLLLADGLTTPALAPALLRLLPTLLSASPVTQLALLAERPYQARGPPTQRS